MAKRETYEKKVKSCKKINKIPINLLMSSEKQLGLPFRWMFLMYQMDGSLETAMLLFPVKNNSESDIWISTKHKSILDSN